MTELLSIRRGRLAALALRARRDALACAVLSLALVGTLHVAQRRIDFSVDEEGFLWYGAVATAHGEVPLRDYRSYDPGRYLWAAAWGRALGDDLLTLRLSTAAFQAVGLFCGLLAARRSVKNGGGLLLVGLLLAVWMYPRYKVFDSSIALIGVLAAVTLVERPSIGRHALAGIVVGLAAFFGKNHGVYLFLAFLLLIAFLGLKPGMDGPDGREGLPRRLFAWAGGIALGSAPLLAMFTIAGFLPSYIDSIRFFLHQGRTNFPLPIPWPWRALDAGLGWRQNLLQMGLGTCFVVCAGFFLLASIIVCRCEGEVLRRRPLLIAGLFVGAFYAHHAVSRADLVHVASCIHPVLLGLVALPVSWSAGRRRRVAAAAIAGLLAVLTAGTVIPVTPLYERLSTQDWQLYEVSGDELWLRSGTARFLGWVERNVGSRVSPGEPILMAPKLAGIYPFLGRRSPVWDVYPIWPSQGELDERMLRELQAQHVRWALIQGRASVDHSREQLFRYTHPQVWTYIGREFRLVAVHGFDGLFERADGLKSSR
jgi:hypothetical protein